MRLRSVGLLLVCLTLALGGCAARAKARAERAEAARLAKLEKDRTLAPGEVFVVGRIDLVPPLGDKEQQLKVGSSERYRNRGSVFLSDRFVSLQNPFLRFGTTEIVEMNKPFVIKRKQTEEMHYSGVVIQMRFANTGGGYAPAAGPFRESGPNFVIDRREIGLPGRAIYKLRPDDRAVYIGTLRYHRDEYNDIKKVEYVDEYEQALKEFRDFLGDPGATLRRVRAEPVK